MPEVEEVRRVTHFGITESEREFTFDKLVVVAL